MPTSSGDKVCPICDSPLTPGSRKCGFCGTDLSIFDIEFEASKPAPTSPARPERTTIESRVDEVLSKPPPAPPSVPSPTPPVKESPKPIVSEEPRKGVPSAPTKATPGAPTPPAKAKADFFECPECGSSVEMSASSCPKCGVMFAEEGTEMFQCPACNTLVDVDAKTCPGCGAMFVEPEEAEAKSRTEVAEPAPVVAEIKEAPSAAAPSAPPAPKEEEKKSLFGSLFRKSKKEEPPKPPPKSDIRDLAAPTAPEPPARPIEAPRPAAYRPQAPAESGIKDKGKDLARMVAEMKPLLALAREREIDIGESKQLIDDAAMAGRERQLDRAIELVNRSKTSLMSKIDAGLAQEIARLNEETKVAREFGGDTSRALTYVQEIARARSSGDVEAAFVYVDKAKNELQPITGRYNDLRSKLSSMKMLVADCEVFIVDSKEARSQLVEASKAFETKDFDRTENFLKAAQEKLYKNIPPRMNEEMRKARDELVNAKMRNVNISPMITVLKSATTSMKTGDYPQALKDMREFKEMMKKAG